MSIIVPTIGRPTLRAALAALAAEELRAGDEVLVIGDGPRPEAAAIVKSFPPDVFRYFQTPRSGKWGDAQRNAGIREAHGDLLMFCDDDNLTLPGALAQIRSVGESNRGRPLIFRCRYLDGRVVPTAPRLQLSDYDTACGVWPRLPGLLAEWPGLYGGDYEFARATLALYPHGERDAVWCSPIISAHRPHLVPPARLAAHLRAA